MTVNRDLWSPIDDFDQIRGFPTIVFINRDGVTERELRIESFVNRDVVLDRMKKIIEGS